jgi:hypothetical protein
MQAISKFTMMAGFLDAAGSRTHSHDSFSGLTKQNDRGVQIASGLPNISSFGGAMLGASSHIGFGPLGFAAWAWPDRLGRVRWHLQQ